MSCSHEVCVPTRRVNSNGIETVFLQCQRCGSGRCGKKSDYDMSALPDFDESIKERYMEEWRRRAAESNRKFLQEQEEKSSEWWQKYNDYLRSPHWMAVRSKVLRRDPICQKCMCRGSVVAHHLTYLTYNQLGFTFPCECVGLCSNCHDEIHEALDEKRRNECL